jgi:hypothetical protein
MLDDQLCLSTHQRQGSPYNGSRNDHLIHQDQNPGLHGKEDGDAILDQHGVIFTNCVLLAITVNAAYIVLCIFMKRLKQKRVVAAAAG